MIRRLREAVCRLAAGDAATLIAGEPGSGRSLLARAIHHASSRRAQPLVTVSCRHLPEAVLDAELFGVDEGGPGPVRDRIGGLDFAHAGTVLLENAEELPIRTQRLLARFLACGGTPRGAHNLVRPPSVRILASIDAPQGRDDHGGVWSVQPDATVVLPPLRDRREDIPILVDYFASVHGAAIGRPGVNFAPDTMQALMHFSWPGNVRELRTVIERLVGTAGSATIAPENLPVGIRPRRTAPPVPSRQRRAAVCEELFVRLVANGDSFWSSVYPLFMEREITRTDVRDLVRRGLEVARGNSHALVRLFNMPPSDHKRFIGFLRKYDCQLPGCS
jgi:DNA-binding NtrC family response regulator